METDAILIFLIVALALISPVVYSISMFNGVSKPARMTRFIVWLAATISFASLWVGESAGAIWLAGVFAFRNTFLLLMSFKYGVGGMSKLDLWCLGIAAAGLLGWQISGNPLVALLFAITADFIGFIPALIKTYHKPDSEGPWFYYIETTAVLLNVILIGAWTLDLIFPIHILVTNIIMLALIFRVKLFKFSAQVRTD